VALNFPNNPGIGSIFTDETAGFSYEWNGTVWKSFSSASSTNIKILDNISGSFNGSTTTFALTTGGVSVTPINAQQLVITLGGVTQKPGTDYTVSTTNITFTSAPEAGLSFSGISLGPAVPVDYANDGNIYIRNTYAGAGTTGPFSFPEGYTVGYLDVYRNGVRLTSTTDYVGTSGTNFFLVDAALSGDELEAIGYKVASLVQASSNLDNLNVTGITTTGRLQVSTNANIVGIITAATFSGNITGVAATFTGNVSIAGTLTYEDVTNVDSVGLVTARTGVRVTAGGLVVTAGVSTFSGLVDAGAGLTVTGIVTATGGFNLGISSAGTSITSGPVKTLNFIGTGNTFAVSGTTVDISIAGGGGGSGSFNELDATLFG